MTIRKRVERDPVWQTVLRVRCRHRPPSTVEVDVRPAHVVHFHAPLRRDQAEAKGRRHLGRLVIQRRPERADLRVRQHTVPPVFRCRPLELRARVELDHLAGDAEVEDLADQRANAVRRDRRRPFGDRLDELAHVTAADLVRP